MNDNESTIVESTSAVENFSISSLREGYLNVNLVNPSDYYNSNKELNEYLKDLITTNIQDETSSWSIVEEYNEFRPTDYIQNPRPIRSFKVENSTNKNTKIFCFDIAGCL
jgi:hypothetical protein